MKRHRAAPENTANIMGMVIRSIHQYMRPFATGFGRSQELEWHIQCIRQQIHEEYGGLRFYISANHRKNRAQHILQLYDGHNIDWLAQHFGVSKRTVYRDLKKMKSFLEKDTNHEHGNIETTPGSLE